MLPLASSGWRPGVLLNVLHCADGPHEKDPYMGPRCHEAENHICSTVGQGEVADLVWFTAVSRSLEQRQAHRGVVLRGGITGREGSIGRGL